MTRLASRQRRPRRRGRAVIAEEHAGHQRGMARREAGIGIDLPPRRKAVGVQDHQRPVGKGIGELPNAGRRMPSGAVIGGHPARLAAACQHRADVPDADKAHHPRTRIDTCNRQRSTPRRSERAMDHLHQRNTFLLDIVGEHPRRGLGGMSGQGSMAESRRRAAR